MKDADKDRCQERARKRALNDMRCAVRKLEAWANDLGDPAAAAEIRFHGESIETEVEQMLS